MPKLKYPVIVIFILLLAVCAILYLVSGSSSGKNDGFSYIIGVSQPNLMEPWRIAMNEEMKAEAIKYPDMRVIFCDAANDNNKQKQDIENLVRQKIDLLIVSANDAAYLSETVSKVYKQGIPVIVMEYPIGSEDYSMLIYSDNKKIGKLAGEYVLELLGEKGGTVLEIQGEPGSKVSRERKQGFREAIKGNRKVKVEYVVVGYWLRDETEARVEEIYKKIPRVDLVFAFNDAMATGAWRVASTDSLNIKIIGVDGLPGRFNGLDAVNAGILDATFLYPTGGKEAIDNAFNLLTGIQVPKILELNTMKIKRENINQPIK